MDETTAAGTDQVQGAAQPAAPAQTDLTPQAATATPAAPTAALEATAKDGPKGQPSSEQQIARIVKEAIAPLVEQFGAAKPEQAAAEPAAEDDGKAALWAVEKMLIKGGCVDEDALMTHVDMSVVKLSDGKLEGVDIAKLQESYPYLFKPTAPAATVSTGAPSAGASTDKPAMSIREGIAARTKN